jgi:hypothetical protein
MRRVGLIVVAGLVMTPVAGNAQIVPTRPPSQQQRPPDPRDTIPVPPFRHDPPVSPLGAAVRSLLIPGWGQSMVGRKATGAVFIFWEGLTLAMMFKAAHQLDYQTDIGKEEIEGKRAEVQDWAVLLAFNHLLAAAEAYVSTHLWDFPADLGVEPLRNGDAAVGMRVYW